MAIKTEGYCQIIYKFKQNNSIFICTRKIIKDVPGTTLGINHITQVVSQEKKRKKTDSKPTQAEKLIIL